MRKEQYLLLGTLVILAVLVIAPVQAYFQQGVGGSAAYAYSSAPLSAYSRNPYGLYMMQKPLTTTVLVCPVQVRSGNPVSHVYLKF